MADGAGCGCQEGTFAEDEVMQAYLQLLATEKSKVRHALVIAVFFSCCLTFKALQGATKA